MTSADGLLFDLYRAGTTAFRLVATPYLRRRLRRGKEDPNRLEERRGSAVAPRPTGPLVWVHGASVGEALAVLPLIDHLVVRGFGVLATTGTLTSARILATRLPRGAIHQFVPLDVGAYVARFLDHWRPDLVLFAESELWPNIVVEVARRRIPMALVNARMSQRSFHRWRRVPRFIGMLLGRMSLCLAQASGDAMRLRALGATAVQVPGNLKFDAVPPPADDAAVLALREAFGDRPVWVAASTHVEEEAIVLDVDGRLRSRLPGLLTIIVPRQADRGPAIARAAAAMGLDATQRSRGPVLAPDTQVHVADTMGELGLFYRAARLVFVGKSLAGAGGQNPIEPAKLGCVVLHGPLVANFADVYRLLDDAGAACAVDDPAALAAMLAELFADDARCAAMAQRALRLVAQEQGATERTLAALGPLLTVVDSPVPDA